jgi:hypothetical protein
MIPTIERPGIRPGFPKLGAYRKSYALGITEVEREITNLTRYAEEGAGYEADYGHGAGTYSYSVASANVDLIRASNAFRWYAIQGAIEGSTDWESQWRQSVAFDYWHSRQKLVNTERQLSRSLGKDLSYASAGFQLAGWKSIAEMGDVVGNCLALGWIDWALALARRVNMLVNDDRILKTPDSLRPRTQFFVFRLIDNWQAWPEAVSPDCLGTDALFDALLAHWRTESAADVAPLLLAECDRRTHQSRINSRKESYELPDMGKWYDPFEIHALMRLRELHGLANPALDHIIMKGPLGALPASTPPYQSDLLDGVVAQLRKFYPEL